MRSVFAQTIVWRGGRGNRGKLELVWSNQRFVHPSLDPIIPVLEHARPSMLCNMLGQRSQMSLQCCAICWGRDLKWVCNWCLWKVSPTLILVPAFIQKKIKMETNKDTTGFESPVSLHFYWTSIQKKPEFILCLLIFFLYCCYNFLFHGKLGMMGNLVGWRRDMRMHVLWDTYLTELTKHER